MPAYVCIVWKILLACLCLYCLEGLCLPACFCIVWKPLACRLVYCLEAIACLPVFVLLARQLLACVCIVWKAFDYLTGELFAIGLIAYLWLNY